MTNVVICGANGMMGKTVANCISKRDNCKVVAGIDINTTQYSDFPIYSSPKDLSESPDVIIDYSNPNTLDDLLEYCLVTGTAVVLATTGYSDEQIAKIKRHLNKYQYSLHLICHLGLTLWLNLQKRLL